MADGLLLSRREKTLLFWEKFGAGIAPCAVLALVALALSGAAVAIATAFWGVVCASIIASSSRKVRKAAIAGVAVAVVWLLGQIVLAWLITHPVIRG